jgi:hypothetical protein
VKNYFKNSILRKVLLIVFGIVTIKMIVHFYFSKYFNADTVWYEFSDVAVVFTGTFFVMSMLLSGTMTDFKESERIPGEVAACLEAIYDWILLVEHVNAEKNLNINEQVLKLHSVADGILGWFKSKNKHSQAIFPLLRQLNQIVYYFGVHAADKEAIKGIQENTNGLRKVLTRAYTITRTEFVKAAYILQKSILFLIIPLLVFAHYKTIYGAFIVTFIVSFIMFYLYELIRDLDNPFDQKQKFSRVDFLALDRFIKRMDEEAKNNRQ